MHQVLVSRILILNPDHSPGKQTLSLEVQIHLVWGWVQALILYLWVCEYVCVCNLNVQPGLTFMLRNQSY